MGELSTNASVNAQVGVPNHCCGHIWRVYYCWLVRLLAIGQIATLTGSSSTRDATCDIRRKEVPFYTVLTTL
jgi:hypothetical protein